MSRLMDLLLWPLDCVFDALMARARARRAMATEEAVARAVRQGRIGRYGDDGSEG